MARPVGKIEWRSLFDRTFPGIDRFMLSPITVTANYFFEFVEKCFHESPQLNPHKSDLKRIDFTDRVSYYVTCRFMWDGDFSRWTKLLNLSFILKRPDHLRNEIHSFLCCAGAKFMSLNNLIEFSERTAEVNPFPLALSDETLISPGMIPSRRESYLEDTVKFIDNLLARKSGPSPDLVLVNLRQACLRPTLGSICHLVVPPEEMVVKLAEFNPKEYPEISQLVEGYFE